jgi:threonine/homoserine/homoserine lactone efflux protein
MLLLWLAYDGVRARVGADDEPVRRELPPVARGSLAILVNPGAWLFLAAVGSPLIAGATRASGTGSAFLAAASLLAGAALGDCAVVLLGGLGVRRAGSRAVAIVRRALALLLAGLGVWLVVKGLT